MASDRMWGGLPFIVPSKTAMKYLHHAKVISEEDVPVGAHYRAREDMINNVRAKKQGKRNCTKMAAVTLTKKHKKIVVIQL